MGLSMWMGNAAAVIAGWAAGQCVRLTAWWCGRMGNCKFCNKSNNNICNLLKY